MIGTFTIGRKVAKYGYRKYGVPGAVVALIGFVAARKALKSYLASNSGNDQQSEDESLEAIVDDFATDSSGAGMADD